MSDVDTVVREALLERAESVRVAAVDPFPGVQRRARQIRQRRAAAMATPIVVGLAAIATFGGNLGPSGSSGVAIAPGTSSSVRASASPAASPLESTPAAGSTDPATAAAPTVLVPQSRHEALAWGLAENGTVISNVTFRSKPQGVLECDLRVFGEDVAREQIYAWVLCQDFYLDQEAVKAGAGASQPAVIHVYGSGKATAITSVVFPRQATLDADIRRLFPAALYDTASSGNFPMDATGWPAQAQLELTGQVTHRLPPPPGS